LGQDNVIQLLSHNLFLNNDHVNSKIRRTVAWFKGRWGLEEKISPEHLTIQQPLKPRTQEQVGRVVSRTGRYKEAHNA
jgi:hypothetical protein